MLSLSMEDCNLQDSGRISPVMTPTMMTSLHTSQGMHDVCEISHDEDYIIQRLASAMMVLQQSFQETHLQDALSILKQTLTERNDDCIRYLQSNQVHLQVIAVLNHLPESLDIQKMGLHVLQLLCERTSMLEDMLNSGVSRLLFDRLKHFGGDQYVQHYCLSIIGYLLSSELYRLHIRGDNLVPELLCILCHAVVTFSEVPDVLNDAAKIITTCIEAKLSDVNGFREHLVKKVGGHILDSLKDGRELHCQLQLIMLIIDQQSESHMTLLLEKDVHITLMELCARLPSDVTLMPRVTHLLAYMNTNEIVQRIMIANNFVENGLFSVMEILRVSGHVQKSGLNMIETLIPRMMEVASKADETAHFIVRSVYNAMFAHIDRTAVQIAGCRTLSVLLEHRPEAHRWIGESPEDRQYPVHNLVVGAMLSNAKDSGVFVSACEAIFWIAADNERLCTMLMSKNVHIAIIDGLRQHWDMALAVETGCRALRGLCIFLHDHKVTMVRDGIFSQLTDLQQHYQSSSSVQIEVLSAIACLSDVDVVRYQCFVERLPEKIITCMSQFPREMMIQEAGLEAFAVLAGAEGGSEMLLNRGALQATLHTMNRTLDNLLIVRKGLVVLQLFASANMVDTELTRQMIVTNIYTALKNFADIKTVQTEACVAIQLLAEADSAMSTSFVETDCHQCLFQLLENDNEPKLQELASECLYVLSQEKNLKSQMLSSACRNGMLPATECLIELGADVNVGDIRNTPLYLAVNYQHENIVRHLLCQDVQDVRTPLKRSLELETHVTTGLILQQIGYDRENSVLCWTGLDLARLHAVWITTSLSNRQTMVADSGSNLTPGTSRKIMARSKSLDEQTLALEIAHGPGLPTIIASSPPQDDDDDGPPVFSLSPTEEEEWREMTLSGANVSYSPDDPRLQPSPGSSRRNTAESGGAWRRKASRTSKGSSASSDDESRCSSPKFRIRKMSAPAISEKELRRAKNRLSVEAVSASMESPYIGRPKPLVLMDATDNVITDIDCLTSPDLKSHLIGLGKLDLRNNSIVTIPDNIHVNLPSLQVLDISSNKIIIYPVCLFKCPRLKELRLGHNRVKDIGTPVTKETICSRSLRVLDISMNSVKCMPEDFGAHFPSLEELYLNKNDLMELPDRPLNLPSLRCLDLSGNDIDTLPEGFLQTCVNLETLDLSYNKLTELKVLNQVKVRRNRLTEKPPFFVPKFLLELPSLRALDISENGLQGLPTLDRWKSRIMKDFVASRNNIRKISLKNPELWQKLEKLHLAENNLSELPCEIGRFTCLRSLDISGNKQIATLPDELGNCKDIFDLSTAGLDLDLPRSVLQRRVKDIISYLKNRLTKAQRYYRMKLMVVGFGGRGKTTLLKTLMKDKGKKENKATVGVVVKNWTYAKNERRGSDESSRWPFAPGKRVEYTLNTWDFAGQEDFYSTHSCYLSNRAVYLVVFDLNRGVVECGALMAWLYSIRFRAPGCPVIVVGTHLDRIPTDGRGERDLRRITEKLREFNTKPGFPTISRVLYVNAGVDDENMEDLRSVIKEIVNGFEIRGRRVMGEKIPASYVELADLLSSKGEKEFPVLDHKQLLELVETHNIDLREDELGQAIRFLHEAGVVLHWDDSSMQLKNYYFINPGWLCQMMAQVITVKQINPFINSHGILRKRDLDVLFKDGNSFPRTMNHQYIKILEKFEIALPYNDKELLIPPRLPPNRPHFTLPTVGKITRIYRMPFVPIGLWFRLIARMISLFTHDGFNSVHKNIKTERLILWSKGMYQFWNEGMFFLLDSEQDRKQHKESAVITVPSTSSGIRILGQIVDGLDHLIDEWYPGLTSIDPMMGQEILEVLAPCTQCPPGTSAHMFRLSDLQKAATNEDIVRCPQHDGDVLLSELASDLVLADMEDELKLDMNLFHFDDSSENQLGDGGFGDVYRAEYNGQVVAVKLFKEVADIHPMKMLRQEVTILRCLKHPSVVSLLAVGLRPPIMLLEYAHHDTLAALSTGGGVEHSNKKHNRMLKHRIALQVAEGLKYLRSIMIVFRDMKPENVLIFSMSLDSPINAKIADYGIARFTTMQGLQAQEGTPGFRAPEVMRKENYSFQADIFSFGLTLYMLLAGRHPFHYMGSRGEMDRAVAEERRLPSLDHTDTFIFPDMRRITMACLQHDPDRRPTAEVVHGLLSKAEVTAVIRKIAVSRSTTVECLAVEPLSHEGQVHLRLWIASGDSETFQLSYMDLRDGNTKTKGLLFNYGRILCMEPLEGHRLAIGTQLGKIWIFNTATCTVMHSTMQLDDSVLCMNYYRKPGNGSIALLLAGLANGRIAIFTVNEMLYETNMDPMCLYPGKDYEPALCMDRQGSRLYVTYGTQIIVLNTEKGILIEKIVPTSSSRDASMPPIKTLTVVKGQLIMSRKSSTIIEIWDIHKDRMHNSCDVQQLFGFGISRADARVTALSADNKSLWVGTHGGYIAVIDIDSLDVLTVTRRYTRAVRSLKHFRYPGDSQQKVVFSGGLGYQDIYNIDTRNESLYGCVLVWDADLPQHVYDMRDYIRKRHGLQRQTSDVIAGTLTENT